MRLAEHTDRIGIENADLTIDGAMALLADHRDNAHFRTNFTGNNEWHTPAPHLALVRQVLDQIDLDPASNDIAQRRICAARYFTKDDDGLSKPWHGRVFMNPPFAYPSIELFIDKLLGELNDGRVTDAVVLTNNFSDTGWFHKATRAAAATCITKGRVRFESPEGDSAQPTQGQTFFYFGDQIDRFREAFAGHGIIMIPDGAAPFGLRAALDDEADHAGFRPDWHISLIVHEIRLLVAEWPSAHRDQLPRLSKELRRYADSLDARIRALDGGAAP